MKRALVLALTLVAAACGSAQNHSSASGLPNSPIFRPEGRSLFPVEGRLGEVAAKAAPAPALGLWTEISVDFEVHCSSALEAASVTYGYDQDGKVEILASAFASSSVQQGDVTCQAFSIETKTITVPGIVSAEDVKLINIAEGRPSVPADTLEIRTLTQAEIIGVRSLCPEDVICDLDGTVVSFKVLKSSCANTLAPISYHLSNNATDKLLSVHVLEFVSELSTRVDCAQTYEDVEITLPMQFPGKEELKLNVMQ